MVGGGRGAFIGETHRIAARLDDRYELVAGALNSDPQRAIESGRDLRLDPRRCYTDYRVMAQAEAARKDGIDVVSVVTPNASHHAICKQFLEAGIDVICDKPLTRHARRSERPPRHSAPHWAFTRRYLCLHGLSNGAAGALAHRCRRDWCGPHSPR
jgi:predicted dehydrogenase